MKLYSVGDIPIDGYQVAGVVLAGTDEEIQAFCALLARGWDDFAIVPKRIAEIDSQAPARENYRETPVEGTDLIVKAWNAGNHVHATISWPPHGVTRPLGLTLTFSQAEVDLLAAAYAVGQHTKESEDLIVNISTAVLVQCGLLRTLLEAGATLETVPPAEVKP